VRVRIIVTGVAGYIGAHVAHQLLESGHEVIGIDDFSTGFESFVDPRINFHKGSIENKEFLISVFSKIKQPNEVGVIHCAGKKFPVESVTNPEIYYATNTFGTLNLLKVMKQFGVTKMVFSSSCSVYGEIAETIKVNEIRLKNPVSPYGRSKHFAEQIIEDAVTSGWLKATSLRYFNVVGNATIIAHDRSHLNLFPNIYRSISEKKSLTIYGDSFSTRDGTCIRDFVDVRDLSRSHIVAIEKLFSGVQLKLAYNLGSGTGFTVKEVVERAREVISSKLAFEFAAPRDGDPASILADTTNAAADLGWSPIYNLKDMLLDGWKVWAEMDLQPH